MIRDEIFGVLGGVLTLRFGEQLLPGHPDLGRALGLDSEAVPRWLSWAILGAIYFVPGALAGASTSSVPTASTSSSSLTAPSWSPTSTARPAEPTAHPGK